MSSTFDVFSSKFAQDIYLQKYSKNNVEKWADTCKRVVEAVCSQLVDNKTKEAIYDIMVSRKFIPGGRYLYSAGNPFHQVNNCFDGSTRFVTKSGVFSLKDKVGQQVEVKNWNNEWEKAEVRSFGVQNLYRMILSNEDEFLVTEDHLWIQPDGSRVTTKNVKRVMLTQGNPGLELDEEGIRHGIIYGDGHVTTSGNHTEMILVNPEKKEHLASYFENKEIILNGGFGSKRTFNTIRKVKAGTKIALQPRHYKNLPTTYTPEYARGFIAGLIATDGHASPTGTVSISCEGMDKIKKIREIAIVGGCVCSSVRIGSKINPYNGLPRELCNLHIKPFSAPLISPYHKKNVEGRRFHRKEMYLDVIDIQPAHQAEVFCVVAPTTNTFTLGNGVITSNCFLFRAEDSREGWADLAQKSISSLMTGGGIGVDYSSLRPRGGLIKRTGGFSTGPLALMHIINESGRYIMDGGQRRSAIWAGLNWSHGDIKEFINLKNHSKELISLKEKDLTFHMPMELTNISVIYDTEFFVAIENEDHPKHDEAKMIWTMNCRQAFSTAEPGMSFNFRKDNESLRNACQPEFAKITLANGKEITMGEVKVGDVLLNCNNKETTVIKKWWTDHKPVYAYGTDKGSFVGTENHKVVIKNRDGELRKDEIDLVYKNNHMVGVCTKDGYSTINSKVYLGDYDVFDITVSDDTHTYLTNGVYVSNCTEVVSEDDSDKCNLGTIWLNRIKDKKELANVTKHAITFLLCGSIYSDVPTDKIRIVGNKNNRIGLGLGGIHEWLMTRGYEYECVPELHKWLATYEQESDGSAFLGAKQLGVAVPKGVRAIAPTGSIGILAETTTGIEPLFCKAYKRRYFKDDQWLHQYVVDGAVKRLLDQGVKLEMIKDSYDLSFKQRVKFQADVQNYVDMAISSTCNMEAWGSSSNDLGTVHKNSNILLNYAKRLRGFTVYPDGARGGQPLTRCDLQEALMAEGQVFEEKESECLNGICGI